jgi:hypothetical protein
MAVATLTEVTFRECGELTSPQSCTIGIPIKHREVKPQ